MAGIRNSENRGVLMIDELPRDITDTAPQVVLTLETKNDLYRRIRDARAEGEKPVPAEFITLSSFNRPIRLSNRISLQNRIKEIGYTGQAEGAFCVFDEDSKTLTAVAGNHRTLAVMPLDVLVMMYILHVNLRKESVSLSQIAFTVEQFFKGTHTDHDLYDSVLQLQKWITDKEKKGVTSARQYQMSAYVSDKHGVHWNKKLDQNDTVKEHLKGEDGKYAAYNALVPADVIGSVMKEENATKALVMTAYRGYKRFADCSELNEHLKYNISVIERTETIAEIVKRFGAFSETRWKNFRGSVLKKDVGYWNSINIFQMNLAHQIAKHGDIKKKTEGAPRKKRKAAPIQAPSSAVEESPRASFSAKAKIQELESRVRQLTELLRQNNIPVPPQSTAEPDSDVALSEHLLMSPAPLENLDNVEDCD